jgi:hypothetical protein
MSELSARGRELLLRYKSVESMPPAGKARLLASIQQAVAWGTPPRFDVTGSLPAPAKPSWVQRAWGSPFAKPILASAFLAVPAIAAVNVASHSAPVEITSPLPTPAVAQAATGKSEPASLPEPALALAAVPSAEAAATLDAPRRVPRSSGASKAGAAHEPTIDGEMHLLNEAQAANQSGDSRRALTLLDEYAVRYPAGRLADVRAVARLVALCNLGQVGVARQEAERFQAKYPHSPFNDRVKGICTSKAAP